MFYFILFYFVVCTV